MNKQKLAQVCVANVEGSFTQVYGTYGLNLPVEAYPTMDLTPNSTTKDKVRYKHGMNCI